MPFFSSLILRDVIANRPAAGVVGRLFFSTDEGKTYRDSGTAWQDCSDTGVGGGVASSRLISTTAPLTGGGDLSADRTLAISNFTGDTGSGGTKGAVPAPAAGDAAAGKYLSAAGTWSAPAGTGGSGSGTVTSVALTVPSFLSVSGSPVTTSGTLAVTAATGQTANQFLATPNGSTGGLGLRTIAAADLPLATTGAFGAVKPDGTTITISGGVITSTSSGGMSNPMTTAGDIIYGGTSGTPTRLAGGTSGFVLTSNGATAAPSWQAATGGSASGAPGQASITNPPSTGWTSDNVNTGGSFDFSSGSYGYMHIVANAANTLQGYYRTAPSAPYSVTVFVRQIFALNNAAGMAIVFGWEDASGKLEVARISWDSGAGSWQTYIDKWSSSTSYNSTANSVNGGVITNALWFGLISGLWLRWTDDNTNLKWYFSLNGLDWIQFLGNQGRTAFLTSPSRIYIGQIANPADGYLQLVSYTD